MNNHLNEASLIQDLLENTLGEMINIKGDGDSSKNYPNDGMDLSHKMANPGIHIPTEQNDILGLIDKLDFSYTTATFSSPSSLLTDSTDRGENSYLKALNVANIRKDFPLLQTEIKGQPLIWLDNAATSQKPQIVIDIIKTFYETTNSNIHRGNYTLSMHASELYERVRQKVADFIHANSEKEIIFVRGTTEGINLVANSFGDKYIQAGDEIIISMIEHHSNILPWQQLCEKKCAKLKVIPVNSNGDILLEEYEKLLNHKTKLVAVTHVSNAIGTVLPVKTMIKMAQQYGAFTLIDGAQAIPHFGANVTDLNCDFYIFSGHKMFGPTGIGIVYGRNTILQQLPPWQVGGGMIEKVSFERSSYRESPFRFEAGTGNIADVMGLGAAIDYLNQVGLANIMRYEKELMQYSLEQLASVPKLHLMGHPTERAGSIPFVMDGIDTEGIGAYLDQYGIALRVGHHCAQPTMAFYGVETMARPSIAFYNLREEINVLVDALVRLAQNTHGRKQGGQISRANLFNQRV